MKTFFWCVLFTFQLLLSLNSNAQNSGCVIRLNEATTYKIPVRIDVTKRDTISVNQLMASLGILPSCVISDSSNNIFHVSVTSFRYELVRNGLIIMHGYFNSAYFCNYLLDSIKYTAENMDVFRMSDIQVSFPYNYSNAHKYKLIADSFEVHLIVTRRHLNTAYKHTMDTILHTPEMQKLGNLYGGMESIDNSMSGTQLQFEPGDSILSMERSLGNRSAPDPVYDWVFKYNINTKEYYIWDKLKNKKLTIDEWKNIAHSIMRLIH